MQVYRTADGQMALSRDDHKQFCESVLMIARGFGGKVAALMEHALKSGAPSDRDGQEAMKYFGQELPAIVQTLEPVLGALDQMLPGFKTWMILMRFGNDKDFILALLAMHFALGAMPKVRGKARRRMFSQIMPAPPAQAAR